MFLAGWIVRGVCNRSRDCRWLLLACGLAVLAGCGSAPADVQVTISALTRPPSNTGTGFFVSGKNIYDANGNEFRIRGINNNHYWRDGGDQTVADRYMPSIVASKANTARVVFGGLAADLGWEVSTAAYRRSQVQAFVNNGIVPMAVFFGGRQGCDVVNPDESRNCIKDTTGSEDLCDGAEPGCAASVASLNAVVDDWIGADKPWVQEFERFLMINIANEWGPTASTRWRDAYAQVDAGGALVGGAIKRIRDAGIKALLVIDAGGSGEDVENLVSYAQAIENADPQHNVVFSIHPYAFIWRDPTDPDVEDWAYRLDQQFDRLAALNVPVIVGEFSSSQYSLDVTPDHVPLDPAHVLAQAEAASHRFGWLGWVWYNASSENAVNPLSGDPLDDYPAPYPPSSNLTAFGQVLVESPQGTKALAQKASIFGAGPVPPAPSFVTAGAMSGGPDTTETMSLRWAASPGATSYNIYEATTPGGEGTVPIFPGVGGTTPFSGRDFRRDTGTYYYQIAGVNSNGEGPRSVEFSGTILPALPPPVLVVTQAGYRQVNVGWTAVSGAVDYFVVQTGPTGTSSVLTSARTNLFTNLQGGAPYSYTVGTRNTQGRWGSPSAVRNATPTRGSILSQGRPATQSSDPFGGVASRAVDGNTDGDWNHGSVTHTDFQAGAWWQVDLQAAHNINSVVVWNRTDCCGERLTNFRAQVSSDGSTWTSTTFPGTPSPSAEIYLGAASARYIRIQLVGTNYLTLAEVQVYGQ